MRSVPAPELREVAETWWDVDRDPVVTWSEDGRTFTLVDPEGPGFGLDPEGPGSHRLALLELAEPPEDPRAVAVVLAEGLAACDFPPTDDRAAPGRVTATLRAAGLTVR